MASNQVTDMERQYQEERRAEREQMIREVERHNEMYVGQVRTYKGIDYQMRQRGHFTCINLPPLSGLDGDFTSPAALHRIIDNLELLGRLPK